MIDPLDKIVEILLFVNPERFIARVNRRTGTRERRVLEETVTLIPALFPGDPEDGGLARLASGERDAIRDGKGKGSGETCLTCLWTAGKKAKVTDGEKAIDEPADVEEFVVVVDGSEELGDEFLSSQAVVFGLDGVLPHYWTFIYHTTGKLQNRIRQLFIIQSST